MSVVFLGLVLFGAVPTRHRPDKPARELPETVFAELQFWCWQ